MRTRGPTGSAITPYRTKGGKMPVKKHPKASARQRGRADILDKINIGVRTDNSSRRRVDIRKKCITHGKINIGRKRVVIKKVDNY